MGDRTLVGSGFEAETTTAKREVTRIGAQWAEALDQLATWYVAFDLGARSRHRQIQVKVSF